VDVDVDADVDASAISSSAISISEDVEMMGSEVGATTAAASDVEACVMDDVLRGAASAARESDGVGAGGVVFLAEERLVDGRRGQERESCPVCLHLGQALD
jgi:hypothetical protein